MTLQVKGWKTGFGMALVVLTAPCFVSESQARTPAPVIEASGELAAGAKVGSLEKRVQRLERLLENQTLVDLVTRVDALQNALSELEGKIEEQGHAMEQLQKRQRDLYLDIDRRLRDLETARSKLSAVPSEAAGAGASVFAGTAPGLAAGGGLSAGTTPATANPASSSDPQLERAAYERAFNLLKEGRYDLAVAAFKTFVQTYPRGPYTDNAQYWLGEANYVQRHFKVALQEFEKVVKAFPNSPKRADALLKMGYTYQELGENDKARQSLNEVVMNYPNTTAARLAKKRLQELKRFP